MHEKWEVIYVERAWILLNLEHPRRHFKVYKIRSSRNNAWGFYNSPTLCVWIMSTFYPSLVHSIILFWHQEFSQQYKNPTPPPSRVEYMNQCWKCDLNEFVISAGSTIIDIIIWNHHMLRLVIHLTTTLHIHIQQLVKLNYIYILLTSRIIWSKIDLFIVSQHILAYYISSWTKMRKLTSIINSCSM